MAAKTFKVSVVTPEGGALEAEATSAVFPAYDGQIGILPSHAPLLTQMGIGLLKVTKMGGKGEILYVDSGFAQVSAAGDLTLLTEEARALEDLEPAHAAELLEQARLMKAAGPRESFEIRDAAFERARVQKKLAKN